MNGAPLRLTPPQPRRELVRRPQHAEAMTDALRKAIDAALKGDFAELDRRELAYLNVLVRIGELVIHEPDGTLHWWFNPDDPRFERLDDERFAPFVLRVVRGYGPQGETALHWGIVEKCRRCGGKLRHVPCRACAGTWHVGDWTDAHVEAYTTLDGLLLEGGGA